MLDNLGQVYAWATPEWVMRTDWRLVLMYGGFASEEMAMRSAIREYQYGLKRQERIYPDSPDPAELRKLRLGKVVRK